MIEPSLQIGGGNWANKSDSLLGYHKDGANFYADELTFSRNSLGSYTDANGLIQSMPYNLLTYSNDFSQWNTSTLTITADNLTSPDGTLNASKIEMTGNGSLRNANELTFNNSYTYSIFVKKGNSRYVTLRSAFFTTSIVVGFDLDTLTAQTDGTIEDYGNDWYRLSISKNISADADKSGYFYVYLPNSLGSQSSVSGNYNYFYGGQIEDRTTALPYFATTTRLNLARVDYKDNVNGSLLLEKQSTNLITYSEDTSQWTDSGITYSTNAIISPDGGLNASKAVPDIGITAANTRPMASVSITTGLNYVFSVFAKAGEFENITLDLSNSAFDVAEATYNLTSGTVTSFSGVNVSQGIDDYGNGWYRCYIVATTISSGTSALIIRFDSNPTGDGTKGLYLWGADFQLGSYPTSYIKSKGAATTRLADTCSKTGISDKIGQTEGTLFLEADIQKHNESDFYIAISNGNSLGEAIYLYQPSSGNLNVSFRTTGLSPSINILSANWNIGYNKIAIAYNSSLGEIFINGVSKGSIALTALPTCNQFVLGSRPDNAGVLVPSGGYKQALLFPTRLSNTQLATLTTL